MSARAALVAAVLASAFGASIFGGCSLGLDPHLLDVDAAAPAHDGSTPIDAPADAPPQDSGVDAPSPPADAGQCTKNDDCMSANKCLVGTCDATHNVCVYDVCPTHDACTGSTCTSAKTCTAPVQYGFRAAKVTVTLGSVGCGGIASRCIAASYPFVVVGTGNGAIAYMMKDPSIPSAAIPIQGLPFIPTSIIASGSRVYFVGDTDGTGPTYRLALAWLDVPSDPLATALIAKTVTESYTSPFAPHAFAGPSASLFLVDFATPFYPSTNVIAPIADLGALDMVAPQSVPASGIAPVVASGSRLVFMRPAPDGASDLTFLFQDHPGTNAPLGGTVAPIGLGAKALGQARFGQGPDGSVLWNVAIDGTSDAGVTISAARAAWLLADGNATTFDATAHVDVETYSPAPPSTTDVAGPIAWVDANTAVVLAASARDLARTTAHVIKKSPQPQLDSTRSLQIQAGVLEVGLASSGGFAFALVQDAADTATLHMFAPTCAGQ